MTVLIGWIGVDTHSPCSAYLLSDSRFSWGTNPDTYNYGRKLFALKNSPDILGYCGDAFFSSQVLSQIVSLDDNNLLFQEDDSSLIRSKKILGQINKQFNSYPIHARNKSVIYHISRDNDSTFQAYKYSYDSKINHWIVSDIEYDRSHSNLILRDGTGAEEFLSLYCKYERGDISGTSRNVYQCFCDALKHTKIHSCGGAPQLVGLYRGKKFNGLSFGIIYNGQRYFLGSPLDECSSDNVTRWYNENFEICDGVTMKRLPNAMRQPNPNL